MANKDFTERNIEIHRRWRAAGGSQGILAELGREYNLKRQRIWSIIKTIEGTQKEGDKFKKERLFTSMLPGAKVSQETHDKFFALAKKRGWSVAFTIRQAVEFYLTNNE